MGEGTSPSRMMRALLAGWTGGSTDGMADSAPAYGDSGSAYDPLGAISIICPDTKTVTVGHVLHHECVGDEQARQAELPSPSKVQHLHS